MFARKQLQTTRPDPSKGVAIFLNVDTEFTDSPVHWLDVPYSSRVGITSQIKSIYQAEGKIFTHPDSAHLLARHPVAKAGFDPVDYLNSCGYITSLERLTGTPEEIEENLSVLPKCDFVLFAYFALAELFMIGHGDFKEDLIALARESREGYPQLGMTRRLRTTSKGARGANLDYVDMPWVININGDKYQVRLTFMDACAIHGNGGYKDFCESAGLDLKYKDNFNSEEKGDMLNMAINRPEDFDNYALGDLYVYDALKRNSDNFRTIYRDLGVAEYFQEPRLTMGATVANLFMAVLRKNLGIKPAIVAGDDPLIEDFLKPATANALREDSTNTKALQSKVEGGRCRNNRPTDVHLKSLIVDIDISGCYGEGQRNQIYPIGNPIVHGFPAASKRNDYWTLKRFIDEFHKELIPGLWTVRVSTFDKLEYAQDFLASWFINSKEGDLLAATKYLKQIKSDTEEEEDLTEFFNQEDGSLKIFRNEILNGVVGHDFMNWLKNVAPLKQREELLNSLYVTSFAFYPRSKQYTSYESLCEAQKVDTDKNTIASNNLKIQFTDGEFHGWVGFNMGDLIINKLITLRKEAQQKHGKKSPLDTLYKLCINTLYGVMCSKFFPCSNVIVGNNITARARALAWYMEKGLHGFQTVTDGCAFELNKVVHPRDGRRVNSQNLLGLYSEKNLRRERQLELAPLGGYDDISLEGDEMVFTKDNLKTTMSKEEGLAWINSAAMEHLQEIFPGVDVLHKQTTSLKVVVEDGATKQIFTPRKGQFGFEVKDLYSEGSFHGSANYLLKNSASENLKMRSYETAKAHHSLALDDLENLIITTRYGVDKNPANDFMGQLENCEYVQRQSTFAKRSILKLNEFKAHSHKYLGRNLLPGDNYMKPGLLKELSISQFTFRTCKQYLTWEKAISRRKDKYGQSIEDFFLNSDGTLNYKLMVETVDKMIDEWVMNPFDVLDKDRHRNRKDTKYHPSFKTHSKLKAHLNMTPPVED